MTAAGLRRLALVSVALLALVVSGCGLPTILFLDAPIDPSIDGNVENARLTFSHNPDADTDDLRGYVLYYKLYRPGSPAVRDDEDFISVTPTEPGSRRLEARGFQRPVLTSERDRVNATYREIEFLEARSPALPLDPTGSSIEFSLDLTLPGGINRDEPYFDAGLDDNDYELAEIVVTWEQGGSTEQRGFRRRNIDRGATALPRADFAGFWDITRFAGTDHDLAAMIPDFASDPIDRFEIVFYAIAQAADPANNFNPYFSEPLRLIPAEIVAGP